MEYQDLSREQLISLLAKRDAQRKLGLVWERDEIDHDLALNGDFVAMELAAGPQGSHGEAPYQNLIIEGDNWDALRWLRMTHANRVDCIFIDPPYNTGSKDWVYNDRYVAPDDRYRHSTWLECMFRRLTLARDLLSEKGVILVCINDDNRAKLELMMDEIFPGMRIGSLVWRSRMGGNDAGEAFLSVNHEHVLVYGRGGFAFGGHAKSFAMYSNPDGDPRGDWRSSDMTASVKYTDKRAGNGFYPIQDPETGVWYPCNPKSVWRYASRNLLKPGQRTKTKTMEEFIEDGKVLFPKGERVQVWKTMEDLLRAIDDGDVPHRSGVPVLRRDLPDLDFFVGKKVGWGSPQFKRHKADLKFKTQPLSSWIRNKADDHTVDGEALELTCQMTEEGSKLLYRMFGDKVFNYPKPFSLVKAVLEQATDEDSVVLDFFAGSGTTAHAALALNAEQGGRRRFILVSSTEATPEAEARNLWRDVCAERVRKAIDGYGGVDGLGGDFAYLKAVRLPFEDIAYDFRAEHAWNAIQAMHGLPLVPLDRTRPVQAAVTDERLVIVYCDRFTEEAEATIRRLAADNPTFVYAWTPGPVREAFRDHGGMEVRAVPDELITRFRA